MDIQSKYYKKLSTSIKYLFIIVIHACSTAGYSLTLDDCWDDFNAKNYSAALKSCKLIADIQDVSQAQNLVGYMYFEGVGISKDYAEARKWFDRAAEQSEPNAVFNIGWMYEGGFGVGKNYVEASKWYEHSAKLGSSLGQRAIGYFYQKGLGVEQDYSKAIRWYRLSAESGNHEAQNDLGYMYDSGLGVPEDDEEAARWYKQSAGQGNEIAQDNLKKLRSDSYASREDNQYADNQTSSHKDNHIQKGDITDALNDEWYFTRSFGIDTWGGFIVHVLVALFVYLIVLQIPVFIIRFAIIKRALSKKISILIAVIYMFFMLIIAIAENSIKQQLDIQSGSRVMLNIYQWMAIVACYYILRHGYKSRYRTVVSKEEKQRQILEARKLNELNAKLSRLKEKERSESAVARKSVYDKPVSATNSGKDMVSEGKQKASRTEPDTMKSTNSHRDNQSDDEIYAKVWDEIETGNTDKALWAKSFMEAEGDDNKAKLLYLKKRVKMLGKS